MAHELFKRSAVRRQTYQLSQLLKKGPIPLEQVEPMLKPIS